MWVPSSCLAEMPPEKKRRHKHVPVLLISWWGHTQRCTASWKKEGSQRWKVILAAAHERCSALHDSLYKLEALTSRSVIFPPLKAFGSSRFHIQKSKTLGLNYPFLKGVCVVQQVLWTWKIQQKKHHNILFSQICFPAHGIRLWQFIQNITLSVRPLT